MSKLKEDSLLFHSAGRPGKLSVTLNKEFKTVRDLSLAYSPGVGFPCLEIQKDPKLAYKYTSKGNFVAVISNGTAVLGFGDIGYLSGKPVMEGKAGLMKAFADVDGIDICVKTKDVEEFITVVKNIGDTWGGINLEDIKAPECFEIEERLQNLLNIPVFHDDQHGTAIVVLAGLINSCEIVNKDLKKVKIVVNGAGAAAIACAKLLLSYGVNKENITLCDSKGVVYAGRTDGMNKYKEAFANNTKARSLSDAMIDADIFIGVSVKDAVSEDMVKNMAKDPIIFAMANPDPEITPDKVLKVRSDAIIGTGRSDYPNQINNLLCFPYLFRGALNVRASKINTEMKLAAALAIASIAKLKTPQEVLELYPNRKLEFGKEYVIPTPFDPRLLNTVSGAISKVAIDTGVAMDITE